MVCGCGALLHPHVHPLPRQVQPNLLLHVADGGLLHSFFGSIQSCKLALPFAHEYGVGRIELRLLDSVGSGTS